MDNVGSELISQFFDGVLPREPSGRIIFDEHGKFWHETKDGIVFHTEYFPEIDFKQIVARLDDYKAAVFRAANDVPTRKSGDLPFLPGSYIRILASTYQDITGRKPGAGIGPFFRFVMLFRAALDPSYKTTDENGDERVDGTVLDAIAWTRAGCEATRLTPLSDRQAKRRGGVRLKK